MARRRKHKQRGSEAGGSDAKPAPLLSSEPAPPASSRRDLALLAGILSVALFLRFFRLGAHDFWIDELQTHELALQAFRPGFWRSSHFLAFMIYRAPLLAAPLGEFSLRLPSVLFSVASLPLIYALLRRWTREGGPALLGALVAALSLFQIGFAQEARYYAMVVCAAAATLWLFTELIERPRLWQFPAWVAANLVSYGFHPATVMLFAAQAGFLAAAHLRPSRWPALRRAGRDFKFRSPRGYFAVGMLVLGLLACAAGYRYLFGAALRAALPRLASFPNWDLTPQVEFSAKFFLSPVRDFALLFGIETGLSSLAGWLYAALFFAGLAAELRRRRWPAYFTAWAYAVAYFMLFAVKAEIPYNSKYAAFLYPCFLYACASGALAASSAAARLFAPRAPAVPSVALAASLVLLLQLAQWRDYAAYYSLDKKPHRKPLAAIRKETPSGGTLVTTPRGFRVFDHYRRQFGFEDAQFKTLGLNSPEIFSLALEGEPLWICPGYEWSDVYARRDFEKMLLDFGAEERARFRSFAGEMYDSPVFFLDGRELFVPGRSKKLNLGDAPVRVRSAGAAECVVRVPGAAAADFSFSIKRGSAAPEPLPRADSPGLDWISIPFELARGEIAELALASPPRPPGAPEPVLESVSGAFPAVFAHARAPVGREELLAREGETCIALMRNGSAEFAVDSRSPGAMQLSVSAFDDMPRPVLVEASVNGEIMGVLAWDKTDNRRRQLFFPAPVRAGRNRIIFAFLNDGPLSAYEPDLTDGNTDFIASSFSFAPLDANAPLGPSPFLSHGEFLSPPAGSERFGEEAGALNSFWKFDGDAPHRILAGGAVFEAEVPAGIPGCALFTVPFAVPEGKSLYYSLRVEAENLPEHEFNILVLWLDSANAPLAREFVHAVGPRGAWKETRFPSIQVPPRGATSAVLYLVVRKMGGASKSAGRIRYSDFKFLPEGALK